MLKQPMTGYRRSDGRVGIRNLVAVMAAADNVNPLARRLAAQSPDTICLPASYGRGQLGRDFEITLDTMAGLAGHPNLSACLIISFEPESAERISSRVKAAGRHAETLCLLEQGGASATFATGMKILERLHANSRSQLRTELTPGDLLIGLECGGSDTTSGLFGNPALGAFSDWLIGAGGTAIFSEPVECLGGEAALLARAESPQTGAAMIAAIERFRDIALAQGVDLTGVNPTPDNIAGGLTTIEEKSLGAIAKSGSRPIRGVLDYGARPPREGLWLMDAPASAVENLTAMSAAGAQAIFFVTGSGNPVGHPISPTIKICANPITMQRLAEHIDVDLSDGLTGALTREIGAQRIGAALSSVADGKLTAAEELGYLETNISRFGLSV